jgi:hypothetical protein
MIRLNAGFEIGETPSWRLLFPDAGKGRTTPSSLKMYLHFNAGSSIFYLGRAVRPSISGPTF